MDRLDELRLFLAIAEAGSLAAAGRRLGHSPPAVTRVLAALEQRLGVRLLERTTRRAVPTEAGRRLAEHARRLLADYDGAMREAAGEAAEPRGRLRVTVPLSFGRLHVAPVVTAFLAAQPGVAADLVLADRFLDLIEEEIDVACDDDGVVFRSIYDGALARFTPELAADVQRRLASDISMCLDVCPPGEAPRGEVEAAVSRTAGWARRQRAAPRADGQLLFGIAQGATDAELRRRSIEDVVALDFDGYALGGLSVGEDREAMLETVAWSAPLLPMERPRYFMGIGDPAGILAVIERGIDMFDCVWPTRLGRTGTALTWEGRLNLKNARFATDPAPLDEGCSCSVCARFSRAYLRHLVNQQELLGLLLLSEHNVRFVLDVTAGARAAIERGELAAYKVAALDRLGDAALVPSREMENIRGLERS